MVMEKDKKTRFLEAYANLPLGLRREIILVLDTHGPITWEVAYIEIENNTPLTSQILERLDALKII